MPYLTRGEAKRYRRIIEQASATLTDEEALEAPRLFPRWQPDTHYEVGDRLFYHEVLYKVLIAHDSQETWTPDVAPSLFARVLIPDPEVIPDWEQPGATNPYMTGDKVRYNGKVYESLIDNNIWSPDGYPAGWREVTE